MAHYTAMLRYKDGRVELLPGASPSAPYAYGDNEQEGSMDLLCGLINKLVVDNIIESAFLVEIIAPAVTINTLLEDENGVTYGI